MACTVILGAGIIGLSIAYHLSRHQPGSTIHLVEPSPELFASASGYAGGFLAKDWFPPATADLGRMSFEEHMKLADQDGGAWKWGYAPSTSISLTPAQQGSSVEVDCHDNPSRTAGASSNTRNTPGAVPSWLRANRDDTVDLMSDEGTAAQVNPLKLCQHLMQKCVDARVQVHHPAKVISIRQDVRGEVSSVCIADMHSSTETDVPCTLIVIAAGAWSPDVFASLFPTSSFRLPLSSLAGHSLIVRSPHWPVSDDKTDAGCHSIFMTSSQSSYSPEIFSRVGGEIYIAGVNAASLPLPAAAPDSRKLISESAIERLRETLRIVLRGEDDTTTPTRARTEAESFEIVRKGLCWRPVTDQGTPILSRTPDACLGDGIATRPGPGEGGIYLAAGHGPWGISLSLGTGKVMAEMIQGRTLSADITQLSLAA